MNKSAKHGKFITFDGIDGAGKTTQINRLKEFINQQNIDVYVTREPGGTTLSEQIRELLLSEKNTVSPMTELLLMFAARSEHISQILQPKLITGQWIICSRFTDATLAYQGYGRNMDDQLIKQLATLVHPNINPDISFFLDLPATLAAKRRAKRNEASDRIENEALSFMSSVRQGYIEIAKTEPKRCKLIDATVPIDNIAKSIKQLIIPLINNA